MLPDPLEMGTPDTPDEDHKKPYWMRQTVDGSLVLHNPNGTVMGDIRRAFDGTYSAWAAKIDGTLHRSTHETEKEAMATLLRLHPDHKEEPETCPW